MQIPPSNGNQRKAWQEWDILWRHFQAHYGIPGTLKFYHSGKVYNISSETGTQQGDPLGTVVLSNQSSLQWQTHNQISSYLLSQTMLPL